MVRRVCILTCLFAATAALTPPVGVPPVTPPVAVPPVTPSRPVASHFTGAASQMGGDARAQVAPVARFAGQAATLPVMSPSAWRSTEAKLMEMGTVESPVTAAAMQYESGSFLSPRPDTGSRGVAGAAYTQFINRWIHVLMTVAGVLAAVMAAASARSWGRQNAARKDALVLEMSTSMVDEATVASSNVVWPGQPEIAVAAFAGDSIARAPAYQSCKEICAEATNMYGHTVLFSTTPSMRTPGALVRGLPTLASRQRVQAQHVVAQQAAVDADALGGLASLAADPEQLETIIASALNIANTLPKELLELLGPPLPANAVEESGAMNDVLSSVSSFFFDPRLQWDENGNVLLDPKGDPLPDNLWTQFVACQATLIKRLNEGLSGVGVPQSFGFAVICYTLAIRALLYPFVKGQLETTAKIQVLAPRVNEIRAKYKDNEERLQQEVGLLYMDLQIDPLGAVIPLLVQLPVFWGLYRAIRRLAIVEYEPLKQGWLWIPSLYGPNYEPDPSFKWITSWQGPLIELHPKMGWTDFGLFAVLPLSICLAYREVLKEATSDENSPKILQFFPFMLAFITIELPQAMGMYIATNIVSSVALTAYTKNQISSKIPGYEEFVKTGEWPPGVDPEKVLAEAFGVERLTDDKGSSADDPASVPEAVFAGRADFIPELLEQGRKIDEFDDRGIPASMYTIALDNSDLLDRLMELGASRTVLDKRGNSLIHYAAGYGRVHFVSRLLESDTKTLINHVNEDGQTPLDVARLNLSQEKVADDVRKVITVLTAQGAEGEATTEADEARFEEARRQRKRKKDANAARSALKALAMAAQAKNNASVTDASVEAPVAGSEHASESTVAAPPVLETSLDRVKSLDMTALRNRLGDSLSEEKLERLSERLSKMSPEDLASYMAGLPSVKAESGDSPSAAAPPSSDGEADVGAGSRRQSLLVD